MYMINRSCKPDFPFYVVENFCSSMYFICRIMYLRCFSVQQGDGSGNFSSVWLGERKLVMQGVSKG